jgi:hypothetical protein
LRVWYDSSPQKRAATAGGKIEKKRKKRTGFEEKSEKSEKNNSFLCVKTYKISHAIQKPFPMLKWVRFCGGKFSSQNEAG